jgi:hypothetical protein
MTTALDPVFFPFWVESDAGAQRNRDPSLGFRVQDAGAQRDRDPCSRTQGLRDSVSGTKGLRDKKVQTCGRTHFSPGFRVLRTHVSPGFRVRGRISTPAH